MEAVTSTPLRIGQVGLGQWGKKLVRNFGELADVAWLCDIDERETARAYTASTLGNVPTRWMCVKSPSGS